jgi:DNA-binding protein Fis
VLGEWAFSAPGGVLARGGAAYRLLPMLYVAILGSENSDEFQRLVNTAVPTLVREMAVAEPGRLYRSVMARVERPLLQQALEIAGGNQLKAARLLGMRQPPGRNGAAEP